MPLVARPLVMSASTKGRRRSAPRVSFPYLLGRLFAVNARPSVDRLRVPCCGERPRAVGGKTCGDSGKVRAFATEACQRLSVGAILSRPCRLRIRTGPKSPEGTTATPRRLNRPRPRNRTAHKGGLAGDKGFCWSPQDARQGRPHRKPELTLRRPSHRYRKPACLIDAHRFLEPHQRKVLIR